MKGILVSGSEVYDFGFGVWFFEAFSDEDVISEAFEDDGYWLW